MEKITKDQEFLMKSFLYFYERKFVAQSDFDETIMMNLIYQLQALGLPINYPFQLLSSREVFSFALRVELSKPIKSRSNYLSLSSQSIQAITELQKITDIIRHSEPMQSCFTQEEIDEDYHVLYWMSVLSATHYLNPQKNISSNNTIQTLDLYFPKHWINNVAAHGRHLERAHKTRQISRKK